MTTAPLAHTDVIVLDYLAALWAQSDDLTPELRDELMSTVADYIAARRGASAEPIEDASAIVRRLGPPEALVEAARRGHLPPHIRLPALVPPPPPVRPVSAGPGGAVEYTAMGLLTAGAFVLPVVGPVAGMLLATGSSYWTPAQKASAWILTAGSVAAAMMAVVVLAAIGVGGQAALLLGYLAVCAGPLLAGASLFAGRRPQPS